MTRSPEPAARHTTLSEATPGTQALLWLGFPAAGAVAGWLLPRLARWVVDLPWAPLQGPAEAVGSLPEPQVTIGAMIVGAIAGVILALISMAEMLSVTVSPDAVTFTRNDTTHTIKRADVSAVFKAGKDLVVLGAESEELAREKTDLHESQLQEAFGGHGFPWSAGGDPYHDEYRRWVEDAPDLPGGANAVLRARQRALERDDKDDVADLRRELNRMGVVVRDEEKRQYWRRTSPR